MTEDVTKFLEAVAKEGEEAIKKLEKAGAEDMIAMAAERGITLTEEDFKKPMGRLSEDDLEAVSGGSAEDLPDDTPWGMVVYNPLQGYYMTSPNGNIPLPGYNHTPWKD